jgi:hypothetical protein
MGTWSASNPSGQLCPNPFSLGHKPTSACIYIAGTSFANNGINAIYTEAKNVFIGFNNFSNNHRTSSVGAPGGQIDLDYGSENIMVWNNAVVDGPAFAGSWWADGIEIHGKDIWLRSNRIRNNGGQGVYIEEGQDVTISDVNGFDGSYFVISRNNRRSSGGFPACGAFPAVSIHSGPAASMRRPTQNITVSSQALLDGHQPAIKIGKCQVSGSSPLIQNVTISNSCLAGNVGGVFVQSGTYSGTPSISNSPTSGCHGL